MRAFSSSVQAAFLFGNFVIGCGVMAITGMLVPMAHDLHISMPTAGNLIAIGGLVMGFGAPLLASLTSQVDRRWLLVVAMLIFAAGHAACAMAPDYDSLFWARCFTVIAPAIFTPQAAATISLLVPPEQRSSALTRIFFGWAAASVLGNPLANIIAEYVGWRWVFGLCSALSLMAAIWVFLATPSGLRVIRVSWATWRSALGDSRLRLILSVTLINITGQFVLTAFLAPTLEFYLGRQSAWVPTMLFVFGAAGLVGSFWITRRLALNNSHDNNPHRAVNVLLAGMVLGIGLWCLLPWMRNYGVGVIVAVLALGQIVWGFCCFSANSGQQARLVSIAPELATVAVALNTSALYLGQMFGTELGALGIIRYGYTSLAVIAAAVLSLALAVSLYASRQLTRSKLK